jgi:hypothetical protein
MPINPDKESTITLLADNEFKDMLRVVAEADDRTINAWFWRNVGPAFRQAVAEEYNRIPKAERVATKYTRSARRAVTQSPKKTPTPRPLAG